MKRRNLFFSMFIIGFVIVGCGPAKPKFDVKAIKKNYGKVISYESNEEYVDRVMKLANYYMKQGYYTEASFIIQDISKVEVDPGRKSSISEISRMLQKRFSPEKEDSMFNSDVIRVAKHWNGKYGYIDHQGKFVIKAKYDKAEEFSDGMALVTVNNNKFFINRKSETALELLPQKKWFFFDQKKKTYLKESRSERKVTTEIYDGSFKIDESKIKIKIKGGFHNGLALVTVITHRIQLDRRAQILAYGQNGDIFVDKKGNPRIYLPNSSIEKKRYNASSFSSGFACVEDEKKRLYGYIDTNGKWLFEPAFKKTNAFRNGFAWVLYPNSNKHGYIDANGNVAIRPTYKDVYPFQEQSALVVGFDGYVGHIDKTGIKTINSDNVKLDDAEHQGTRGTAIFQKSNGLIPIRYNDYFKLDADRFNEVSHFKEGIAFFDDNKKRVVSYAEEFFRHDNNKVGENLVGFFNGRTFFKDSREGSNVWGMMDLKGNTVVALQSEWTPIEVFRNGLAKVKTKSGEGFINRNGRLVHTE